MNYKVEIFCGDRIHHYKGVNGKYSVIFPGNGGGSSYFLGFFPTKNPSAPITQKKSWDFIPDGNERFYDKYERLIDAERAIETFERRLK